MPLTISVNMHLSITRLRVIVQVPVLGITLALEITLEIRCCLSVQIFHGLSIQTDLH